MAFPASLSLSPVAQESCPTPPLLLFSVLEQPPGKHRRVQSGACTISEEEERLPVEFSRGCCLRGKREQKGSHCSGNKGANPQCSPSLIYLSQVPKSALPST